MKVDVTLSVEIPNNVDPVEFLNECNFTVTDENGKELETEIMDYDYEDIDYSDCDEDIDDIDYEDIDYEDIDIDDED